MGQARAMRNPAGFLAGGGRRNQNVYLPLIMTVNKRTLPCCIFFPSLSCENRIRNATAYRIFFPCRQLFLGWSLLADLSWWHFIWKCKCPCLRRDSWYYPGEQKHGGIIIFFPSYFNSLSQTQLLIKNHLSLCPTLWPTLTKWNTIHIWSGFFFPLTKQILFTDDASLHHSLPIFFML